MDKKNKRWLAGCISVFVVEVVVVVTPDLMRRFIRPFDGLKGLKLSAGWLAGCISVFVVVVVTPDRMRRVGRFSDE